MSDRETTIDELKQTVAAFSEEREWQPFHSLKNLAMSMSIESGELMEHFQWVDASDADDVMGDSEKRAAVEED